MPRFNIGDSVRHLYSGVRDRVVRILHPSVFELEGTGIQRSDDWVLDPQMTAPSFASQSLASQAAYNNRFYPTFTTGSTLRSTAYPSGKFKEGDRVKKIQGNCNSAKEGNIYTLIKDIYTDSNSTYYGRLGAGSDVNDLCHCEFEWELVAETKTEEVKKKPNNKNKVNLKALDALIIENSIKSEITAVLNQREHADKIFNKWGLNKTIEYGKSTSFMFWGVPGTGKTHGANCIAKALNRELLIISAAEIQSSEPGGANRNIQNAFKDAKEKDKVLFLDECDSLIANRKNLGMILGSEINTLLTEIEKYEGVLILATNRIVDMDPALERRISLIVEFKMPTYEQRKAIWKNIIPKKFPLHNDVNVDMLAEHEFSGGLIKNVLLHSARLAASDKSRKVTNKHFSKAIERVKSSQGLMGKKKTQYSDGVGVSKVESITKAFAD